MAADDIIRVAVTVSVVQVICDLVARYFVYQKVPYKRAVEDYERAQAKYEKLLKENTGKPVKEMPGKSGKQQDKLKKRLDRAKDDVGEAKSEVAKKHSGPGMITSFFFLLLFRILWAEHSGKVLGVLPFAPWSLFRRVTLRGLDFGEDLGASLFKDSVGVDTVQQACSFTIIYILCNMGVKFYVHKLVGEAPPAGADGGLMAVMENPKIAKGLKQMGLDPDEFKQD